MSQQSLLGSNTDLNFSKPLKQSRITWNNCTNIVLPILLYNERCYISEKGKERNWIMSMFEQDKHSTCVVWCFIKEHESSFLSLGSIWLRHLYLHCQSSMLLLIGTKAWAENDRQRKVVKNTLSFLRLLINSLSCADSFAIVCWKWSMEVKKSCFVLSP